MKILLAALLAILCATGQAQVIDTHLHGWTDENYPQRGPSAPATGSDHMRATIAAMDQHDVRFAVVSGNMDALAMWTAADDRFIPGYQVTGSNIIPPGEFEQHVEAGRIKVLGEFAPLFVGKTPADSTYTPYLEIAEKHGVPLAFHAGGIPPMAPMTCCPEARVALGNPLLVEDILVRHPKLKVYLQHGGEAYYREALSVMRVYRHVYADLGAVLWVEPLAREHAAAFLREAKLAGLLDRVMFGSDQMNWPGAIGDSIAYLESLGFLTPDEKRMILYDNASRFFALAGTRGD
jgi:predicted TIM-barrel fold metal-dependent hydrolase